MCRRLRTMIRVWQSLDPGPQEPSMIPRYKARTRWKLLKVLIVRRDLHHRSVTILKKLQSNLPTEIASAIINNLNIEEQRKLNKASI